MVRYTTLYRQILHITPSKLLCFCSCTLDTYITLLQHLSINPLTPSCLPRSKRRKPCTHRHHASLTNTLLEHDKCKTTTKNHSFDIYTRSCSQSYYSSVAHINTEQRWFRENKIGERGGIFRSTEVSLKCFYCNPSQIFVIPCTFQKDYPPILRSVQAQRPTRAVLYEFRSTVWRKRKSLPMCVPSS
jgi:hypothetical protein